MPAPPSTPTPMNRPNRPPGSREAKHVTPHRLQPRRPQPPATPATPEEKATELVAPYSQYNLRSSRAKVSRRNSKRGASSATKHGLNPSKDFDGVARTLFTMASGTGKWREEQILIICPGSRTTMAQLGCNELTPPARRMPTRMFRDGQQWAPYYKTKRVKVVNGVEEEEWVEDVDEDAGAVWPIQGGRIVNMEALLAFLDHVHGLLTTTYHNTPIMLMASPQWTRPDCETIARYIFENTKTPALCFLHSGLATQYGLKWPNMTVVDIGFEKVDVTAIHDGRVVNHMDLGPPSEERRISGGEVFTQRLIKLLEGRGFTYDMAEQLKKSPICEVLPYVGTAADLVELPSQDTSGSAPGGASGSSFAANAPKADGRAINHNVDDLGDDGNGTGEDDGVLDVASIVTSGQTKEFLAKKEKERAAKAGRKAKDKEEAAAARPVRLPNSKKTHNTFFYEEIVTEEVPPAPPAPTENGTTGAPQDQNAAATGEAPRETKPEVSQPQPAEKAEPEMRPKKVRRDIEIGLERFKFAERKEIDRIVTAIYRTIQGIDDMYMRPACWDNLVFVGNGARLRGLKENIMQTLTARHLVSPSTATMFTSELPSNMATPTGTGAQTPTGSFTGAPHLLPPNASGVNPLLQAATTASLGQANAATPQAASEVGGPVTGHHFHSQTPTSIKMATLPTYLTEWSKNGYEEAMFLGAQVAARIAFCLHSNMDAGSIEAQRLMSLSRVDYNELGPKGIRTHSMLG